MVEKISNPLFKNLIQVGMVVSDLQISMQKYVFDYGIGPMYVVEFNPGNVSDMYLYGKKQKYSMNMGVCPIGDVRFEIIEPVSRSIYSDYIEKYGQGIIHHLKLGVENYWKSIDYLESLGVEIMQSGHQLGVRGKNMYTYMNTQSTLGFIVELVNVEKDFIKPEPDCWFPQDKQYVCKPIFKRPIQVGVVVKDLGLKIKQLEDLFGLSPWKIKEFSSRNTTGMHIYGKKKSYATRAGFYVLGNIRLELIEPLTESIFSDFFERYGEGVIHHVSMEIENYHDVLNYLKSINVKIIQSGCYQDRIKYSYLATDSGMNFVTEIIEDNIFLSDV
ncbi:MAG: hypothetical protein FJW66_06550 [Actinobacteria bacterium]|nr:hypothetical protein [Actinomycetota bacterium]